jgi:hypothetical protein
MLENPKEGDHLEVVGIDGKVSTGFVKRRIGTSSRLSLTL